MSYPSTKPLLWAPSSTVGVTVTTGVSWANGAYVQLISAMSNTSQLAFIVIGSSTVAGGAMHQFEFDIAIGPAGSEAIIATPRFLVRSAATAIGESTMPLSVPIDAIPAGSRVAVRGRTSQTSGTITLTCTIGYYENLDSTHITTYPMLSLPSAAGGTSVTGNATAWANSGWGQVTAGLATVINIATVVGTNNNANLTAMDFELDVGIGAAGSEVVITTVVGTRRPTTGAFSTSAGHYLPRPYQIPANTRVAIRLRKSGIRTDVWPMGITYYTDPNTDAVSIDRDPPMAQSKALATRHILGRNGIDPPQELPDDLGTEVLNMDFYAGSLGQKRPGASAVTLNGFTAGGRIGSVHRYLPTDNEAAAELWATESGALTTAQRLAAGTSWATVTLADAIQANEPETDMISFNGKLFQAYDSAVNRLHAYTAPGGSHIRTGLAIPAVPTSGTVVAGTVTDSRKYAVCWTKQTSGVTLWRSNLGTQTSAITLTAQQHTLTRPALASESETHWELYVYSDDDNYSIGRLLATTVTGTSTFIDNQSDLSSFTTAPPLGGANTPFPSVKYLLTDGTHLIGGGAWETSAGTGFTPSTRLIVWTPALGTSATDGDDFRMVDTTDTKNFLYVDAGITGMGGPLHGNPIVFAYRQIYKLVPTGQATSAYNRVTLRTDIGCIRHKTIVLAEDETGQPALYWLSHRGPYRMGGNGIEFLGRDVQDRWDLVNLGATSVVGWGMYLPEKGQIHWYVSVNGNNDPNERLIFDVRLGRVIEFANLKTAHYGWGRHTGVVTESRCGCLFANTLAASMSRDMKPYLGRVGTGISDPTLWKGDNGTTDAGTAYQSYVKTKAFSLRPGQNMRMLEDAYIVAQAAAGVTLTLTVDRDFNSETGAFTASIAAAASETRVFPKVEGAILAEAGFVQFQLGDASVIDNTWIADGIFTPLQIEGSR